MFLVFDFDGTLADTHIAFREAFDEAATIMSAQPFRQRDEAQMRALEASDVLRAHGISPHQFADFTGLLKHGMESRQADIRLVPGVADALDSLGKMQRKLGLITSNSAVLVRSVLEKHLPLFNYLRFDVSIGSKEAVLADAVSECSVFGRLHYVGDEIRDFRAASAAGVEFSAVTWGFNTEASLRAEGCNSFIQQPGDLVHITP